MEPCTLSPTQLWESWDHTALQGPPRWPRQCVTHWPVSLVSQVRRLSAGAVLKASCSTDEVKPKALKKESQSSVCSLSCTGDL